jgi:hypothetical protein
MQNRKFQAHISYCMNMMFIDLLDGVVTIQGQPEAVFTDAKFVIYDP